MSHSSSVRVGTLVLLSMLTAQVRADWPQWGGPSRDFSVVDTAVTAWSDAGPPALWQRELGPGYSAVVVNGGQLVTMYRRGDHEVVVAVSVESGKTLWEHAYPAPATPDEEALDTSYGAGPNSTPLLAGQNVYTLGFTGMLNCVRMKDGKHLWSRNLADKGISPPYFGHASSPLRSGDTVIVVAGGAHAFDLESGETRWSNTSFTGSYASPVLIERATQQLLIVPGAGEIIGIDPANGKALWRHEHANQHRTILSSPVLADDDWVFVSAYYIGSIGLKLAENGSAATRHWENRGLQLSHSNAVRDGDWVYGFHNSILTAINVKTGEIGWRHRGIRKSNLLKAGKQFLLLDDLGKLVLASLTSEGIDVRATFQVSEGRTWSAPTLSDQTLFVRTADTLMALDLSGRRGSRLTSLKPRRAATERRLEPPAGFMKAKRRLSAAIFAADPSALEASRTAFKRWTESSDAAHLAHYYAALSAWQQSLASEGTSALALVDLAVDHSNAALALNRDFADAHALLSSLYSMYYRLDRGRAAVIGPKGDEHLAIALLKQPDNPRVVTAEGLDLVNSPPEYGGDRQAGLQRLRDALSLFESAPAENSLAEPDWGHATTWYAYGRALLAGGAPDRDGARAAFERALEIEPRLDAARRQMK